MIAHPIKGVERRHAVVFTSIILERHAPRQTQLNEIPRAQLTAAKAALERIFRNGGNKAIARAYEHGLRLNEIAAYLGVHYATVSRRLNRSRAPRSDRRKL